MQQYRYGLDILQASAGSGKTFHLVFSFLKIIVQNPHDYDKILAITFTNKATEEMKSRILKALSDLSTGKGSPFYHPLEEYYQLIGKKINIREHAYQALNYILLDYTNFSVSTIESFFQRVVRGFARELDIPLGYDVEMRNDYVIQRVVDDLLTEAGFTEKVTQVLSQFIADNIEQDKGWRIEDKIRDFAQEMLKEIFQRNVGMDRGADSIIAFEEKMQAIETHIKETKAKVEEGMRKIGKEALSYMQTMGIDESFFAYSRDKRNLGVYFRGIAHPNSGLRDLDFSDFFLKKMMPKAPESYLAGAAKKNKADKEKNIPVAEGMAVFVDKAFEFYYGEQRKDYYTIFEAQKTLQSLRLIHDLQRKFAEYREENNLLLISDTSMLLNAVIENNEDAPFVYEKIGNRYVHYLIDEFQDTSVLQWRNLLPLLRNTLSENEQSQNIIVGDAKQSIYRWRGGEMKLLLEQVEVDLSAYNSETIRIQNLQNNWRTGKEIVLFNNALFGEIKKYYQDNLQDWLLMGSEDAEAEMYYISLLERAYGTASQIPQKTKIAGFVEFHFISPEKNIEEEIEESDEQGTDSQDKENDADSKEDKKWQGQALKQTLQLIRKIEKDGFPLSDVMILTRKNDHTTKIVTYLNEKGVKVTSSESLRLDNSPLVKLLVAALYYILDENDALAASTAAFYYHKWYLESANLIVDENALIAIFQDKTFPLPTEFQEQRAALLRLPLYESVQKLLRILQIHHTTDAYLQGFLDWVMDYTRQNEDGISGFLAWWEEEKKDKYVVSAPDRDSVRITTIHKSKGLEFPIVILPFCDWEMTPKSNTFFWANTDVSPFEGVFEKRQEDEKSLYPVRISQNLIHTHFQPAYLEECFQVMMDAINMLYVAFTRPEYRLYAIIPDLEKKEKEAEDEEDGTKKKKTSKAKKEPKIKKKVGKLLTEIILNQNGIEGKWVENGTVFRKGEAATYWELHAKDKVALDAKEGVKNAYHPIDNWEQLLRVRMQHNAVYRASGREQEQKMSEGIVLHDALQFVKTQSDIPKAIAFLQNNGSINDEQKKYFTQQLFAIVNHPIAKDWFMPTWTIKTEAEILCVDGRVLRPDRVLIDKQKAVIIDYKTGNASPKYFQQIQEYAFMLQDMGYTEVKGYLFYFSENKVVEVL